VTLFASIHHSARFASFAFHGDDYGAVSLDYASVERKNLRQTSLKEVLKFSILPFNREASKGTSSIRLATTRPARHRPLSPQAQGPVTSLRPLRRTPCIYITR
jgi:hypothetical protein